MSTYSRGKPTSPARPGKIIKEVLLAKRPLISGELVQEAAIVDLCNVYKNFIYEQNQMRAKGSKLKGMVYSSFLRLFKFSQLLGLVTLVREEPMLFPPGSKHLYSIRKRETDGMRVFATISKRRIFKLTDLGREDDRSWTDLCRAWREGWHAPEKIIEPVVVEEVEEVEEVVEERAEEAAVILPPLPPKAKRGRKPKAEAKAEKVEEAKGILLPTLKLSTRPSKEQYPLLLTRLQRLNSIGISNKVVQKDIDKLANTVGEWVASATEDYIDAQEQHNTTAAFSAKYLRDALTAVDEALLDRDIPKAIKDLQKLTTDYIPPIAKPPISAKPVIAETPKAKPDIEDVKLKLSDIMDETKKAASITKLEKVLAQLDYDMFTGLEDIESAIEDYKEAERDDKESAFEDIVSAIDEIELVEEERSEEEE